MKIGIQVLEEEMVEMVIEFLKELVGTPSSKLEALLKEKVFKEDRMQSYVDELSVIDKKLEKIAPQIKNLLKSLGICDTL